MAPPFFKAKIRVIGIGGGGASIVSEIGRSLNKATFVVADTDTRAFKKRAGIKHFLFGQELTHGLGTGVNPDLGKLAAEAEKDKIAKFFEGQDIVIFVASLGGGLGSGAAEVFAEAPKNFQGITFGIFTLPFKFEGKNKHAIAMKALRQLRKSLNASLTIPNERIFKIIKADTSITSAFSTINKNLIESLESLIDLIYSPGIINIDFADLKAILKGKGSLAFLNTAEAAGKQRAETIAQKILHNPLYQNLPLGARGNNFAAQKILFNIEGGGTLSMLEVDKISKAISSVNPNAKIIFGISKNAKYGNKIKTTLLMTGAQVAIETPRPKIKPVRAKKAQKLILQKPLKKERVIVKKQKKTKKDLGRQVAVAPQAPMPVFNASFTHVAEKLDVKKIHIVQEPSLYRKKAIRRTAIEARKAEQQEEQKQSTQEKEWEIPAFLRKVKFKP